MPQQFSNSHAKDWVENSMDHNSCSNANKSTANLTHRSSKSKASCYFKKAFHVHMTMILK